MRCKSNRRHWPELERDEAKRLILDPRCVYRQLRREGHEQRHTNGQNGEFGVHTFSSTEYELIIFSTEIAGSCKINGNLR